MFIKVTSIYVLQCLVSFARFTEPVRRVDLNNTLIPYSRLFSVFRAAQIQSYRNITFAKITCTRHYKVSY